jgi:hypothetical protein
MALSLSHADFGAGRGGSPPFLKPPFNVRSETKLNNTTYILATPG